MGAYTSRESCAAQGSVVNCTLSPANVTDFNKVTYVGKFGRGGYPPNQDIAGIGVSSALAECLLAVTDMDVRQVLGTFLGVTVVSLLCSVVSTIWWWSKNVFRWKQRMRRE